MSTAINWQMLSQQWVITFAHFLWQALLVGALLAISLRCSRRGDAKTRYAMACLAYLALPACVMVTFAVVPVGGQSVAASGNGKATNSKLDIVPLRPSVNATNTRTQAPMDFGVAVPISEQSPGPSTTTIESASGRSAGWDERFRVCAPYALALYLFGVGAMLSRNAVATWSGRRLRRSSQPVADSRLLALVAEQAGRMRLARVPAVAICRRLSVPVVVGILKPAILLPPALLSGLDAHQVAAILRHEMAHIRRYDPVVHLLQKIVESLLFFHPVTWWISRRINAERENCCDDLAAVDCGHLQYAGTLLRMAELCAAARGIKIRPQLAAMAADGGNDSQLSCRIHRLLGEPATPRLAFTRTSGLIALGAVLICSLSALALVPSGDDAPQQTEAQADTRLTVTAIDAQSGQPIAGIAVRLRDDSGMPIVHGHGSGNFFERTDERGKVRFGSLKSGHYSVEVLGKQAQLNQFVEYLPMSDRTQVNAEPGENLAEITVSPRHLSEQEISKRFPFSAFGRVIDPGGEPLADVEIRAATGIGSLRGGGTVTTDADGRYRLYFGPGMRTQIGESSPLGVGVQAAHFFAEKAGWELIGDSNDYELLMSDQSPEQLTKQIEKEGQLWGRSDTTEVCFPGKPRELNFVLRPAAQQDAPQVAPTSEPANVDAKPEPREARFPYCVVEVENLGTRTLADAIAAFNEQSMESPVGRFEPPVTETETLAAITSFSGQSHLPASVRTTLQEIVSSRTLPATAYFRRFTRFDDGQLMHQVWWVRLVISGDAPPVYSVPVRTKLLSSRSYTQLERQQHATGGLTLLNRFSSYFEVPPNILLLAEFPQDAKNRLIADAKAAIAGDADALQRIYHWQGVSGTTRQFVTAELQQLQQASIESIEIRPRNFKAKMVHWSAYQQYQPNLPIVGYLDIKYKPAADDSGLAKTLSLEMASLGKELRLVNYIEQGKREVPPTLGKGLSVSGQMEPLADGTFLMTTIATNPGRLLSAHLGNEEIWKREF